MATLERVEKQANEVINMASVFAVMMRIDRTAKKIKTWTFLILRIT